MVKKKYLGKKENNKGFGKTLWCAGCECARRGRWAWLSPGLVTWGPRDQCLVPSFGHFCLVVGACKARGREASRALAARRLRSRGGAPAQGLPRRAVAVDRCPPAPRALRWSSGVDLGEMRAGTCSWERSSPQTWFSQHLDEGASSREYGESNSLFLTVGNFWAFFCQAVYMLFLTCRAWISFIPGHLMCTAFWLAYTFALACLILK